MKRALALLALFSACQKAPSPAAFVLPEALVRAQGVTLDAIRGTLTVFDGSDEVASFGPVEAVGSTLAIEFDGLSPGTYTFRVRLFGDSGSATDLPLLDYVQSNIVVQEGAANNLSATGGAWQIPNDAGASFDRDGDGVDDTSEVLQGFDPGSPLSLVASTSAPDAFIAISGTMDRALFALSSGSLRYLGDQRRGVLSSETWDGALPLPVSVNATIQYGSCTAPTFRDLSVVGPRVAIGATGGCILLGEYASLASIDPSTPIIGHATENFENTPVTKTYKNIALGVPETSEWTLTVIHDDLTAGIATTSSSAFEDPIAFEPGFTGLSEATWQLTDSLAACGMPQPIWLASFKLMIGSGYSGTPSSGAYHAIGHWQHATDCNMLFVYTEDNQPGTPITHVRTLGCDMSEGPYCTITDWLHEGAAAPAEAGTITAAVVAATPLLRDEAGSPVLAAYLSDDQGHIYASSEVLFYANATWTLVATTPNSEGIVDMVAPLESMGETGSQALVQSIFVATPHAIYRLP